MRGRRGVARLMWWTHVTSTNVQHNLLPRMDGRITLIYAIAYLKTNCVAGSRTALRCVQCSTAYQGSTRRDVQGLLASAAALITGRARGAARGAGTVNTGST